MFRLRLLKEIPIAEGEEERGGKKTEEERYGKKSQDQKKVVLVLSEDIFFIISNIHFFTAGKIDLLTRFSDI